MDPAPERALIWALLACTGGPAEAPQATIEQAADQNVFASTQPLGPYTLDATIRQEDTLPEADPVVTEQTISLRWKDDAHWAFELARDGKVTSETEVWDGVAWHAEGGGKLAKAGDPEPYRVQLAETWDPWALAFGGVRDQLRLEPGDVGTWEGRRAVPHTLALVPLPEKTRRAWIVGEAQGEVWLDEATALRVKADVHVTATSGRRTRRTSLTLAVTGIGTDPTLVPPGGS